MLPGLPTIWLGRTSLLALTNLPRFPPLGERPAATRIPLLETLQDHDSLKTLLVPIHRAGWPFIALFAAGTVALYLASGALGIFGAVLTLWCIYFFRDPDRVTPAREGLIVSPADGIVQMIDKAPPPDELDMGAEPRWRVCVFMNVFNVHVNRIPATGTLTAGSLVVWLALIVTLKPRFEPAAT